MTAEFESEVRDMCNLSKALVEQGIEQKNLSLAKMIEYSGLDVLAVR